MSAFARFVLGGGEAHGEQVIAPETLQLMFQDQYIESSDPQTMGLGWKLTPVLGDEMLAWHDGGPDEGIGSLVALLPDRELGVVLVANATSFGGNVSAPLATDILGQMLEAKTGIVAQAHEKQEPPERQPAQLERYTGTYIAFGEPVDVKMKQGQLRIAVRGISASLVPVGPTTFRVHHWLLELAGLANLFPLAIDPADLAVEFPADEPGAEDWMFINMAGYAYEPCPKYPDVTDVPKLWTELAGTYELRARLPRDQAGDRVIGTDEIQIEDGILTMPGVIGPLRPISETEIAIQSGPFAGETVVYDPSTGYLYHQWVVYRPVESD
jgi:hypothetical protein